MNGLRRVFTIVRSGMFVWTLKIISDGFSVVDLSEAVKDKMYD